VIHRQQAGKGPILVKRTLPILAVLVATFTVGTLPVRAQNRYIVRTNGGWASVLNLCSFLGCHVQGSLDGNIGQTFLVTSSHNLVVNLTNFTVNLLDSLLGIQSIEPDTLLSIPAVSLNSIPAGLYDNALVNYYGALVTHGYAAQPAAQIIRLTDAQQGFAVTGSGIVAVIDTGVDVNHPVLSPVLVPGYDFTRNQPGASEWLDVPQLNGQTVSSNSGSNQPVVVQQSSAAILDQSSAAILDNGGGSYAEFGHGTMTTGLVHLAAPTAKILPLKAFSASGTGYLSNIVAAIYYAVAHNANIVNMSFDVAVPSPALSAAISYANQQGLILVAAAGNEGTSSPVYPAALNSSVMGIASTTDWDARSSYSNFGDTDVWIAAPGEYVISTFPGGSFAAASGTSFSSPLVAGSANLLMTAQPGLSQSSAASAFAHAVQLTPDLNHGRLDVYQALSACINNSGNNNRNNNGNN
jgi:subtilase family protein